MGTKTIVVLIFFVALLVYFMIAFTRQYKVHGAVKPALKHILLLSVPLLLVIIIVEFIFRILVSYPLMRQEPHFFTRNFATAYFIKNLKSNNWDKRHIRLRELAPYGNYPYRPDTSTSAQWENYTDITYGKKADSDGFVLPEYYAGDQYIFFLGGSTTECALNRETRRFPYMVGAKLAQQGLRYTAKNAGVSGNHVYHNINTLLNKILAYNPKVVVHMETVNDLTILLYEKSYHNQNPWRSLIEDAHTTVQSTMNADEYYLKRGYSKKVDTTEILRQYKSGLIIFIAICRSRDITPVLMTQFNRIDSSCISTCKTLVAMLRIYENDFPGLNSIALYKRFNDVARQVAIEQNVPLIDLDRSVPKTPIYMYDIVHLNDSGSAFVANIITDSLISYHKRSLY